MAHRKKRCHSMQHRLCHLYTQMTFSFCASLIMSLKESRDMPSSSRKLSWYLSCSPVNIARKRLQCPRSCIFRAIIRAWSIEMLWSSRLIKCPPLIEVYGSGKSSFFYNLPVFLNFTGCKNYPLQEGSHSFIRISASPNGGSFHWISSMLTASFKGIGALPQQVIGLCDTKILLA